MGSGPQDALERQQALAWYGDRLSAWLAEREKQFPQWTAAYGTGGTWDFSPPTIDDLAAALFRMTPTPEQLDDPANAEFVDGATWYLGQTLGRAVPAEWIAEQGDNNFCLRKNPTDESSLARANRPQGPQENPGASRPGPTMRPPGQLHRHSNSPNGNSSIGAQHRFDFILDSLDALESMIRQFTPTPEDLLENPVHAEFLNGAACYYGETLCRASDLEWKYDRQGGADCYLRCTGGTYGWFKPLVSLDVADAQCLDPRRDRSACGRVWCRAG